jgi:VIT1/CCC1 family predicted Fe2+/Mn2+ transporter
MDPIRDYEAEQRSLKELLANLSNDASQLFRQEVALAKAELDEKLSRVKKDVAALAIGGGVLVVGALTLVAAIVLVLAEAMPAWVAALLVGVALAAVGAWLTNKGKRDIQSVDFKPAKSIDSIRTDLRTMKEAVR